MKSFASLMALSLAVLLPAPPAHAQERNDQGEARKAMRAGSIMKSREIESRLLPTMSGYEYLGFSYDSTAMVYRLKFIRDGRVAFVDVDARSGQVLRQR